MGDVTLVVVGGRPLGAEIALPPDRFLIGRDRSCHLRPRGPGVGGRQCAIERRGPHLVVRDLAGGTTVNGQDLRGTEATLGDGDVLAVGPLRFAVRVEDRPGTAEFDPLPWLAPNPDETASPSGIHRVYEAASPTAVRSPAAPRTEGTAATSPPPFAYRLLDRACGAVCVGVGPLQLLGDAEVRAMRRALIDLVENRGLARVVVDLSAVDMLPSVAVAMLLALARRCRKLGGELRLCGVPGPVARFFERLGVDDPVADFADRTEALGAPWA